MKSSRTIWNVVAIISVSATLFFVGGFAYAVKQILYPTAVSSEATPSKQSPVKHEIGSSDKISILALGDSLTAGSGDSTGKGYVVRLKEKLQADTGKQVYVRNNLSIPGYVTDKLLADVSQKKTRDAISEADMILISIGGNDIFAGGAGMFGTEVEFNPEAAKERVKPALTKLSQIVEQINQVNPKATVMYLGLYHPFIDMDSAREGGPIVQAFNLEAFNIMNKYPQMIFVPTYDLFERDGVRFLSLDHFHPNGDGYERIADRYAQVLK
ncbi:GDSL-type esterase/lipase family protein [Paenibacillus sp. N1-5-1-14]|uniref:GDSL-type esterase/lipase family protein n=1 Tax=Paenibacillus radicibacter TaxID=2972488 RepID=UPI0021598F1D|nr:GDSL-type esterase/lipase family protein [Paenibacillus radicibacter]MCR8641684.1 GDSL-type esterase/lipase family protein [Paenibacillus radicibacter]